MLELQNLPPILNLLNQIQADDDEYFIAAINVSDDNTDLLNQYQYKSNQYHL